MKAVVINKTESNMQLALWNNGKPIQNRFEGAITSVPRYKTEGKGKGKKKVKDKHGNDIVMSETVKLLPRKSKDNPDMYDLIESATGKKPTAQGLMLFEAEARQELLASSMAQMSYLVGTGHYTYDMSRTSLSNGKFMLSIKPKPGMPAILTPDELDKQAKAMGYKLVKVEDPKDDTKPADKEKPKKGGKGKTIEVEAEVQKS